MKKLIISTMLFSGFAVNAMNNDDLSAMERGVMRRLTQSSPTMIMSEGSNLTPSISPLTLLTSSASTPFQVYMPQMIPVSGSPYFNNSPVVQDQALLPVLNMQQIEVPGVAAVNHPVEQRQALPVLSKEVKQAIIGAFFVGTFFGFNLMRVINSCDK